MSGFLTKASKFFLGSHKRKKHMSKEDKVCPPDPPSEEKDIKMEEEKQKTNLKDRGKLFVGGLSCATTTKNLENYFSRFGKVVDAVVKRFPDSSKSRGFGFVTFADPANAEAALEAVHVLDDKIIEVRPFCSKGHLPRDANERVFLGGVPSAVTESDLKDFFTRYGEVVDAVIPHDRDTKTPKGYAFVSFKEKEAAEKCLAENFVYFRGKRVCIKKAEPKDGSKTNDSSCVSDPFKQDDRDVDVLLTDDAASLDNDETKSSSSGEKFFLFEQFPRLKRVFDDYFLGESEILNGIKEVRSEEVDEDVKLQKLLKDLFTSLPENVETTGEDLIDFSDDETFSDSDEDDTTDDGNDQESDYSERPDYEKILELFSDHETCSSKSDFNLRRTGEGSDKSPLTCLLCHWRPPDDSRESFLAHCQTAAHRQKLKERFVWHQSQESKTESQIFGGSDGTKETYPLVESSEKTSTKEENSRKRRQRARKKQPDSEQVLQQKQKNTPKAIKNKQQEKAATNIKQPKQPNQQKGQQKQQPKPKQGQKNKNSSGKTEEKNAGNKPEAKLPNLKVEALAKGMISIRPLSENKLQCVMCKKTIPKASDFVTLMKNVSQHLHSKKHLNNLSLTENSLKNALEENASKQKGLDDKTKKNVGKENNTLVEKANQKAACGKMGSKQKKQNCGDGEKTSKGKEPEPGPVVDFKKGKGEKKASKGSAGPQILSWYSCLYCNFSGDKLAFNNHLRSKSHSENLYSRGVSSDNFTENSSICKSCMCVVFGSLIEINQHYKHCSR